MGLKPHEKAGVFRFYFQFFAKHAMIFNFCVKISQCEVPNS